MEKTCDKLERERDEARAELEMWRDGNIMHEFHRDELQKAERERNEAIQERERWKMQAEQKWGMRRELEELLQVGDTECEEQFAKGLAALRNLIQERDEARAELEMWRDGNILHENHRDELEKAERERDEARAAAISRRYTCHECGRKGRHSKQNRGAQPICPPCDFSRLFGSGRPEDWEGFEEAVERWRNEGREMSDRPTPETDAFAKTMYSRGVDSHHDGREALKHAKRLERERDEAREALIPFISLNPNSQRVREKWDGFVQAAKKALEGAE